MTLEEAYILAFWTLLIFVCGMKFDQYLARFFYSFFVEDEEVELEEEDDDDSIG